MFRYTLLFTFLFSLGFQTLPAFSADQKKEPESPKKRFVVHMDQIVVTTPMNDKISSSAKPVNILHDEELRLKAGATIGETLKNELGVHGQSFGPGVGLPVIRGQSGPRVRVLSNGLGANDASQQSPDHGSSSIPLVAKRVEILRGPATLLYGSGAIGGVVNVIDGRIPEEMPDKLLEGSFEQKYNSVSDEHSTVLKLEGGNGNLAYHFDGFYRENNNVRIDGNAIDESRGRVSEPDLAVTQNSNGFINNSSADAKSTTGGLSYIGDFGFFGVSANYLENEYGVPPEGTADGEIARIELEQSKVDFKSEFRTSDGFFESYRTKLSFTDYEHVEAKEALFRNDTLEARLEAPHRPIGIFEGVMGFQLISGNFSALELEENEFIVPITHSASYAVFAQESFPVGPTKAEFGFRIEHATVDSRNALDPDSSYTPISVSASDLWQVNDNNSVNFAVTRSQRAPQVQELFFTGLHEATRAFERGNPNLGLETSYNLDLGYKFNSSWVSAQVDLFHNWVDDYIFVQRSGATVEGAPELLNRQTNAKFYGYEASLIFPIIESKHLVDLTLFSDYTRATLNSAGDVPQIPPLRWGFQLDYALGNWNSNLRLTRAEEQNSPGDNEADTPSYVLLNLATHYHIDNIKGMDVLAYAKGNNLLDDEIRNSTSFLRNFSPEPGIGAEVGIRINY
jgi:iron complex outermembrane receptor protein